MVLIPLHYCRDPQGDHVVGAGDANVAVLDAVVGTAVVATQFVVAAVVHLSFYPAHLSFDPAHLSFDPAHLSFDPVHLTFYPVHLTLYPALYQSHSTLGEPRAALRATFGLDRSMLCQVRPSVHLTREQSLSTHDGGHWIRDEGHLTRAVEDETAVGPAVHCDGHCFPAYDGHLLTPASRLRRTREGEHAQRDATGPSPWGS